MPEASPLYRVESLGFMPSILFAICQQAIRLYLFRVLPVAAGSRLD